MFITRLAPKVAAALAALTLAIATLGSASATPVPTFTNVASVTASNAEANLGNNVAHHAMTANCPGVSSASILTNVASVDADNAEASVANNTATHSIAGDGCLDDGTFLVTKIAQQPSVEVGSFIPWEIIGLSQLNEAIEDIDIVDQLPVGLAFVPNSTSVFVNNVFVPASSYTVSQAGTMVQISGIDVPAGGRVVARFTTQATIGLDVGQHTNYAFIGAFGLRLSNIAEGKFEVRPTPVFDCSTIVGAVFRDQNRNGYRDQGEGGIPAARMTALVRGTALTITADSDGRYHIPCAAIPDRDIGSNIIVKLDERTLPSGARVTTENPRVVRATRGKMTTLDFGAFIDRVIRVDLNACAFNGKGLEPTAQSKAGISALLGQLKAGQSTLRISYRAYADDADLADRRVRVLKDAVKQLWRKSGGKYELLVETDIVVVRGEARGACY